MFQKSQSQFAYQQIDKVGLIVGHTKKAPGAKVISTSGNITSEYQYHKSVVEKITGPSIVAKEAQFAHIAYRDNHGIEGATREIIKADIDLSIELHTNASNGSASGVEAFYYMPNSKIICDLYCQMFATRFKRKNRGAKDIKKNGRGVTNLSLLQDIPYAILVEPFFGDNQDDYVSVIMYATFLDDFARMIKSESLKWS